MNQKTKNKIKRMLYYKRDLENRVVNMKKGIDEVNSVINTMELGKKKKKKK